ncbi:phosphatase PAP2 family protein [Aestuariivirga sp.]|uniref:phosphatase PAP2 family protein n=1 Tax=Aestuariivirga sp. TaxID=2650926 RepID=UPI003BAB775F
MRFWTLLWLSLKAQALIIYLAAGWLLVQMSLALLYPKMNTIPALDVAIAVISTLMILLLALVCQQFAVMAIHQRPKRPIQQLLRNLRTLLTNERVMTLGLPAFLSLMIFIIAFSNIKANIPVLAPFTWDRTLDHFDMVLHFGRRPWEWLQPVLGHWPVTLVIGFGYGLWFVVMFGVWVYYAFLTPPGVQRTRFFLAFILVWGIGGNILAIAFSSAGPCFFGAGHLNFAPDPYAPLLSYLRSANETVPIWALPLQEGLWKLYLAGSPDGSLSAMPSVHNATALLFALASTGWPRWVRAFLWGFVAVIFLGSVHLGWHYAVDGYVGWAVTLAVWFISGKLAKRWEDTQAARHFRRLWQEQGAPLSV